MNEYEVIIVGGGPAGIFAALTLAEGDAKDILLLEQGKGIGERQPRMRRGHALRLGRRRGLQRRQADPLHGGGRTPGGIPRRQSPLRSSDRGRPDLRGSRRPRQALRRSLPRGGGTGREGAPCGPGVHPLQDPPHRHGELPRCAGPDVRIARRKDRDLHGLPCPVPAGPGRQNPGGKARRRRDPLWTSRDRGAGPLGRLLDEGRGQEPRAPDTVERRRHRGPRRAARDGPQAAYRRELRIQARLLLEDLRRPGPHLLHEPLRRGGGREQRRARHRERPQLCIEEVRRTPILPSW